MQIPDNKPAFYFPVEPGIFQFKPGLLDISSSFGNGPQDHHVFQFDNHFHKYRDNKVRARNESLAKYFCQDPQEIDLAVINRFILRNLVENNPGYFVYQRTAKTLECKLTAEQLVFNQDMTLIQVKGAQPYINTLDALAMQVQEDIAIMQVSGCGEAKLLAVHLCAPNHWAASDKLGASFETIHSPVPGMGRINQRAKQLNKAMLNKGPYVRFAWGLSTDTFLNHHPVAPQTIEAVKWQGRQFDPSRPKLYLRVERQTLNGFADQGLVLFTIRTYFYDIATLRTQQKMQLSQAIKTMDSQTLNYKGITDKEAICEWLTSADSV